MKKKSFLVYAAFTLLLCNSHAQGVPSFYPFKGFHVGLTGQAEFIQPCSFVALTGTDPAPRARWSSGWEAGMEFSYHFAKYFGITLGINYGTVLSYKSDVYLSSVPDGYGGWKDVNEYDPSVLNLRFNEFLLPVKLEFHYPLRKDFFFMAEAGVKVKGVVRRLLYDYEDGDIGTYATVTNFSNYPASGDRPEVINYYNDLGVRNMGKISCDLLLGVGLYYKLPYGDLLRFSAGANISFTNIIEGSYVYHLTESHGTFAVKNDFIYTQLSYIHTLNFQKAKKYLKKQEFSFSSKKERRNKIIDLLNTR
ncbi:MAG: hypothetical protein LBV02_06170 [Bacteroidales bacterium]|jgi:hypothetical protein|nr:hypothetical protein [Bacteroidales bacterium]